MSVLVGEDPVVDHGERLDAGQHEVLGHLAAETAHARDQDARGAEALLSVEAPKTDLGKGMERNYKKELRKGKARPKQYTVVLQTTEASKGHSEGHK